MSVTINRSAKVTVNRGGNVRIISEYPPINALNLTFNISNNTQNWFIQGSTTFSMTVDWGDGNADTYTGATNYNPTHIYLINGNYNATITFADPTVITYLDISTGYGDNRLTSIGSNIGVLTSLTSLILGGNLLTSFSSTLPSTLQILDLSNNLLTSFDTTQLPNSLTDLYLNDNDLTAFAPAASLPPSLVNLYLNNNAITSFNPSLALPIYLNTLNLSNNLITTFATTQTLPSTLETLNVSYNALTSFTPSGYFPTAMRYIYLNNNSMSSANISTTLQFISSSASWSPPSPNSIDIFNQVVGSCISSSNTYYVGLTNAGWTVTADIC
jgi:Leucine-rich repeat (LRR) protein